MMRARSFCLAAFFIATAAAPLFAETFVFGKKSSVMTGTYTVRLEKNGSGFTLSTQTVENGRPVTRVNMLLDERLATLEWSCWSAPNEFDVKAVRDHDRIVVTGVKKGRPVNMTLVIDGRPWIQQFPFGFQQFIASNATRLEYWVLSPRDFQCVTFAVVKTAEETVSSLGREETAWKSRISLTGFLGGFWGADYWLRASDGRFLRYRGNDGPGTPDVAVDLIGHTD